MQKMLKPMPGFLGVHLMIAAILLGSGNSPAPANSHPLYEQLRDIKLSGKAVEVQGLVLKRDTAVFTFHKGAFYFLETVENRLTGCVFMGEGEFAMSPVLAEEQHHLTHLTGGPSIKEQFSKMVLRFTDGTSEEIAASGEVRQVSSVSEAKGYLQKIRKLMRKGKRCLHPNIAVLLLKIKCQLNNPAVDLIDLEVFDLFAHLLKTEGHLYRVIRIKHIAFSIFAVILTLHSFSKRKLQAN